MSLVREFARALASPLLIILVAASLVAASVGERTDATIIILTVLIGAALDAFQTARSSAAVERLRRTVVPTATVRRGDAWVEVSRRELGVGDVIRLVAGDLVPADAQLLTSTDLHVQQAALTGESLATEKAAATPPASAAPGEPLRDPLQRDAVFLGTSIVSGVATAVVRAVGDATAFGQIAARLAEAPPPTELELGLRRFATLLAQTVVFLVLVLLLVSIALHRDPLESLLFAVALAVGIVPEFMPMVMSITLATGAVRMAKRRVIVKHLAAIHNFGSIDVLCSDKTGTLTSGDMRLVGARSASGADSRAVARLAAIAAHVQTGVQNPLDEAIRRAVPADPAWEKLGEAPFDFERRRMSVAVRDGDRTLAIVMGAPESVVDACARVRDADAVHALDPARRGAIGEAISRSGAEGKRTLAVATRDVSPTESYSRDAERELTLEGWLGFEDPILEDAPATVAALEKEGVRLKILTGDDEVVACHICAAAGIDSAAHVRGAELDRITDAALGPVAERTTLFSRVSPQQKLRVIRALKSRGHVVGYVGDGINDAPSLHAADVGIAPFGAVDVAKDAADIVLLDRGLSVLHTGIVEGRKAFGNVMKYVLMGASSNFGNMFSMAVASFFVPFLPMLPTQILLNNFLYDVSQIAIPSDRVDDAYMRKPHRWDVRGLRQFMVRIGLVSSVFDILTFVVLLRVLHAVPTEFRTGWFVESLLTQTLVLLVIRTTNNPFRSPPSVPLACSVGAVIVVGLALPFSPIGAAFGFVRPPGAFLVFVGVATALYLGAVELAKRTLVPRLMA